LLPTINTRLQFAAIVLAEELHYGRAAQRLLIAVPTLREHITLLEKKLGIVLFLRNSKGVEVTEAGRAYFEEPRSSLAGKKAINGAHGADERMNYVLTIGHTPYTDPNLIRTLLTVPLPFYPNIKVQLHSDFACLLHVQERSVLFSVVGKQVVSLRYEIDQVFELVGQAKVPHWRSYDNSIRVLKALDQ